MRHYNPEAALMELDEEGILPSPVHLRDMIFRARLNMEHSLYVNRQLQAYLKHFGETQKTGRELLQNLTAIISSAK
jgi:hypothetical protein